MKKIVTVLFVAALVCSCSDRVMQCASDEVRAEVINKIKRDMPDAANNITLSNVMTIKDYLYTECRANVQLTLDGFDVAGDVMYEIARPEGQQKAMYITAQMDELLMGLLREVRKNPDITREAREYGFHSLEHFAAYRHARSGHQLLQGQYAEAERMIRRLELSKTELERELSMGHSAGEEGEIQDEIRRIQQMIDKETLMQTQLSAELDEMKQRMDAFAAQD